ncbi:hypothetical protein [Bradyrhizobium sp. B117]|uniref:hypothetical protein n=1 Tax=Bradyrhizobium sp. B117 TaxID=3140246 RepID=UPI0031841F2D
MYDGFIVNHEPALAILRTASRRIWLVDPIGTSCLAIGEVNLKCRIDCASLLTIQVRGAPTIVKS